MKSEWMGEQWLVHPESMQKGACTQLIMHASSPSVAGVFVPCSCAGVVVCSSHIPDHLSVGVCSFSTAYMQTYDSYPSSRQFFMGSDGSMPMFAALVLTFSLTAVFAFVDLLSCIALYQSGALCAAAPPSDQQFFITWTLCHLHFGFVQMTLFFG